MLFGFPDTKRNWEMDERTKTNRAVWDEMARIHVGGSDLYPIEDFLAGKAGTERNIPDNLGSVKGKSILHLQCHIGLDTLMWARQGARVTGVDFSPEAIKQARALNDKLGLDATFLESEIATLPESLDEKFDIVLTYFGTIGWLSDLQSWGKVAAHFLKSGGFFYLADSHPLALLYEVPKGQSKPSRMYDYFMYGKPIRVEGAGGTYANPDAETTQNVTYEWQHTLSDVLGALISAGLDIEYLHEFPYTFYNMFYDAPAPLMKMNEHGWWQMIDREDALPLMFSVKATKP
jgi:SAM-dependent methyltransferase